ncbi:ATP-dependent transcriptional activator MalT (plasmid) [Variovorax sp. PBS-H4]|uniref:helix-turn-helix transcriptional regulator n=1 Tax=Variovorax sp. PBS-H4 TaxID=434008 RepID=UPI001317D768|nr:LuxR C-terminal-related transcriptional regulator [Variovorax sp. PBS-H4]VTU41396.1 ATP-dependent transcriptional activator MalT [Variovorax sp. PBS-H4]
MSDPRIWAVPRLPRGLLDRPQVEKLLGSDAVIHVVHGPAGAGKTTVVAQWAHGLADPVAWVSVHPGNASRHVFWRDAATAVIRSFSDYPAVDPHSREPAWDAAAEIDALMTFLRSCPSLVLVIDGAHLIEDEAVFADLTELVTSSRSLRVVVTTRAHLSLMGSGVQVQMDVDVIGPESLVLQPEETAQILAAAGPAVSDHIDQAAHRAAGGSILAARLIAATVHSRTDRGSETDRPGLAAAGEEYLRKVLRQVPDDGRLVDFMLLTSTADTLPPPLAQVLVPTADVSHLLRVLEDVGGGMAGHVEADGTFVYHPLLREGLRARLRRSRPADLYRLRALVAQWELEHGDAFRAFDIAVEIDDLAFACHVAKRTWLDILRFHADGIIRATNGIKIWRLQQYPLLSTLMAAAHNTRAGGRFRAMEYFAAAALGSRIHHKTLNTVDRIILTTLEGSVLRVSGNVNRALTPARKAMLLIDHADPDTLDELGELLPALLANNGVTFLSHSRYTDAMHAFESAATAAAASTRPRAPLHPLALKAGTAALAGDLDHARTLVDFPHQTTFPAKEVGTYLATLYHVARTVLFMETFDFTAAAAELDLLDDELPTNEHRGLLLHLRALTVAGAGDPLRAAHLLRQSTVVDPALRRLAAPALAQLHATSAVLFTLADHVDHAQTALDAIPRRWRDHVQVQTALAALHRGHSASAEAILARQTPAEPTTRGQAERDLLSAILFWRAGRAATARHHFTAAAVALTSTRMRLPVLFLPADDLSALREAFPDPAFERLLGAGIPLIAPPLMTAARLTPRERLVMTYLARHLTASQIAAELHVSVHTIKSQMNSAYRKLGARRREEAVREATRLGLIGRGE